MPSTILAGLSGGVALVSGAIYSGVLFPLGGVQLHLAKGAPSLVYACLPNFSGDVCTGVSGGSLSSGGLADGMEMNPGDSYFIPKSRLVSGIETIRINVPAAASGGRMFYEGF